MTRPIAYWRSTAIVAVMLLFALSYLTGNEQVVSGFTKAGYRSTFGSSLELPNRRPLSSCCCRGWLC